MLTVMAFGFPAYHEETFPVPADAPDEVFRKAFESLGWTLQDTDGKTRWAGMVGLNLSSWGEKVSIQEKGEGQMQIRSECRLPTQCFDWGRNRRNVTAFLAALEASSHA